MGVNTGTRMQWRHISSWNSSFSWLGYFFVGFSALSNGTPQETCAFFWLLEVNSKYENPIYIQLLFLPRPTSGRRISLVSSLLRNTVGCWDGCKLSLVGGRQRDCTGLKKQNWMTWWWYTKSSSTLRTVLIGLMVIYQCWIGLQNRFVLQLDTSLQHTDARDENHCNARLAAVYSDATILT